MGDSLNITYCEENTGEIIDEMLNDVSSGIRGIHRGALTRRRYVASERASLSFKALNCSFMAMTLQGIPFAPVRLLFPSSNRLCVHKEEIQRLRLLIPFDNNTTPDPETLLPSHSLKVLERPPNFTVEINVFIQLQMLELNTHTSNVSTSPPAASAR